MHSAGLGHLGLNGDLECRNEQVGGKGLKPPSRLPGNEVYEVSEYVSNSAELFL